jgi:hypothetical protein
VVIERWQWCSSGKCGPLASFYDSIYGAAPIFDMTAEDFDLFNPVVPSSTSKIGTLLVWLYLMLVASNANIPDIASAFGAQALVSQSLLENSLQLPLPLNQWQIDVSHWFDIALATYQAMFMTTALGFTDPALKQSQLNPSNDAERKLCNSQVCFKIQTNVIS